MHFILSATLLQPDSAHGFSSKRLGQHRGCLPQHSLDRQQTYPKQVWGCTVSFAWVKVTQKEQYPGLLAKGRQVGSPASSCPFPSQAHPFCFSPMGCWPLQEGLFPGSASLALLPPIGVRSPQGKEESQASTGPCWPSTGLSCLLASASKATGLLYT